MDGENWMVKAMGISVESQLAVLEESDTVFSRGMLTGFIRCLRSAIISQCVDDDLI